MKTFKILVIFSAFLINNIQAYTTQDVEKLRKISAAVTTAGIPLSVLLKDDKADDTNHRLIRCPHIRQKLNDNNDNEEVLATSFKAKLSELLWSGPLLTNQILSAALEKDKSLSVKLSQRFWQLSNAHNAHKSHEVPLLADAGNIVIAEAVLYGLLKVIQNQFPKKDQVKVRRILRILAYTATSSLLAASTKLVDAKFNSENPEHDLSLKTLIPLYLAHHTAIELVAAIVAHNIDDGEEVA